MFEAYGIGDFKYVYISPEAAMLISARWEGICYRAVSPIPWEVEGSLRKVHPLAKIAETVQTPYICTELRVAWAICLAPHPKTRQWAIDWLSGRDRTVDEAKKAARRADSGPRRGRGILPPTWAALAATERSMENWNAAWAAASTDESLLMPMFHRAKGILAGTVPAEEYDK